MKKILLVAILLLLAISGYSQLIRGPYLQVATQNSMIVRWRTEVPSTSHVKYGVAFNDQNMTAEDNMLVNDHEVKITGLLPETRYFYSVGSSETIYASGEDRYFETAPAPGKAGKYRFGVLGDCGTNSAIQGNVRDQLINYVGTNYLNTLLLLGDNAYSFGRDPEYQANFFNHYSGNLFKKTPIFPSPGNHDYYNDNPTAQDDHKIIYYDVFTMPTKGEAGGVASENEAYYSYDYGNVHFLSLDSYGREDQATRLYDTLGRQVTWIKADLAANKNKDWVVAYWHHPPYTLGTHNSDTEVELVKIRENFIRILERYGVDLILCGHSHVYERSKLMKGHFDKTNTFNASIHNQSQSSGKYDGTDNSCPYLKTSEVNTGTVYAVVGSSGQIGGVNPGFPQKAMYYSDADRGGSMLLEVEGNRLDAKWIAADGQVRDKFTIEKNVSKRKLINLEYGSSTTLTPSYVGNYEWNTGAKTKTITVSPKIHSDYIVRDEFNCVADTFNVRVSAPPEVKLNSFVGQATEVNAVVLNWETESEPLFSNFSIEKSLNSKDFIEVGKINSAGKPDQKNSYNYQDTSTTGLYAGESISYRLKFSYQDERTGYSPVIIVKLNVLPPFNLVSFEGSSDAENNVALIWRTGSERESSEFIIERSSNGKDFMEIGRKSASKNSTQEKSYDFADGGSGKIISEDTLYYRLQMVELSGTVTASKTLAVKLNHVITSIDPPVQSVGIEVVPNPSSKEDVRIRIVGKDKLLTKVVVSDVSGKTVFEKTLQLSKSLTPFLPSGLSAGVYFVKVVIGEKTVVKKFVIL